MRRADYPFAADIVSNVPIYEGDAVREAAAFPEARREMMAEWVEAMTDGPGIIVFRRAFADLRPIEDANALFWAMIDEQNRNNSARGDHFAKPGANDRVWNALEKLCLADPAVFAAYYANDIIALVSEAWLGPGYQITSQLNVVNPGGEAQVPHRDYHMGFQTAREIERFPAHAHRLSPMLTLQGAVAHCDMPLESGPTLYLPFSQTYLPGYLAALRDDFRAYFEAHKVQLPLEDRRRRVLQSGLVPRRGLEPHEGRQADRQPVAGLERLRPRDGERRPAEDERHTLSGSPEADR